jgi:hypothetical protein
MSGRLSWDDSPRTNPLSYPGDWLPTSALIRPTSEWPLLPRRGRRLSQARVRLDADGLPGDDRVANVDVPLNYVLLRLNQPSVGQRYPVLSIGASPAPSYMRHVLDRPGHTLTVPLVQARVEGLEVAFAATVTEWGYVPVTPVIAPDRSTECFVMWLDEAQLAEVDEPESGFMRIFVPVGDPADGGVRITLPSGEILGGCYVYVNRHGILTEPDGRGGMPADISQPDLMTGLLARSESLRTTFGETPHDWAERASAGVYPEASRLFEREGWVLREPWFDQLADAPVPNLRYDEILPVDDLPTGAVQVRATREPAERDGDSVVRISRVLAERVGPTTHVRIRPAVPGAPEGIAVIAAIIIDDDSHETDRAELDQVVRNAIGIEVGESVYLEPAQIRRRRWPDLLIGTPNYVTGRMQRADLTTVERDVCLMDSLTLELLGVESGEEVVLEGGIDDDGEVAQVRIAAFATSAEIQQRRSDLDGGDINALFPSSRDALGVHPDLPWMFLDRGTRDALRLGRKLAPVRVRSSRTFQLRRELREMMLLFGIAFIGVLQIIDDQLVQIGVLTLLILMITGAIAIRMRGRLSRHTKGGPGGPWTTSTVGTAPHRRRLRR